MKIVVFSDIHGNQYTMRKFCKEIADFRPDRIFFLGDVFGYYYGQNECLDLLRALPNLQCILGNHDEMFLQSLNNEKMQIELAEKYGKSYLWAEMISAVNIKFLLEWPTYWGEIIDGLKMGFCHGALDDKLNGRLYPDGDVLNLEHYKEYDVVFYGHTHHKMKKTAGKTDIYNPGSIGQQRDGRGCSYIVFDTATKMAEYRTIDYEREVLLAEIEKYDPYKENFKEVLFRRAKD